jgi:hypothetical protein
VIGPDFVKVHEEHYAVGEDVGQLREALVALRGRDVRRHRAAGERLEAEQQPGGIVGHLERELAVGLEGEDHAGPLGFV